MDGLLDCSTRGGYKNRVVVEQSAPLRDWRLKEQTLTPVRLEPQRLLHKGGCDGTQVSPRPRTTEAAGRAGFMSSHQA